MSMDEIPQIAKTVWQIAKTVLPWMTGGLAGAIIGFLLNRRVNRKREARLRIATKVTEFSISGDSSLKDGLLVSYHGAQYAELFVAECEIENSSGRTILEAKIVFEFDQKVTHVADPMVESIPISPSCSFSSIDSPPKLQCAIDRIERGAAIRLRFLANGVPRFRVAHAAAKDDPDVMVAHNNGNVRESDDLVPTVAYFTALYVLVGGVPLLGSTIRGGMIVFAIPVLQRVIATYRAHK